MAKTFKHQKEDFTPRGNKSYKTKRNKFNSFDDVDLKGNTTKRWR